MILGDDPRRHRGNERSGDAAMVQVLSLQREAIGAQTRDAPVARALEQQILEGESELHAGLERGVRLIAEPIPLIELAFFVSQLQRHCGWNAGDEVSSSKDDGCL